MNKTLDKISEMKKNGFSLDFSDVLNDTFTNYKRTFLIGGVVCLLLLIIVSLFYTTIAGTVIGFDDFSEMFAGKRVVPEETPLKIMGNFLLSVLSAALIAPISAGFYKMNHQAAINEDVSIGDAFIYYRSKYFKNIFIAAALISSFTFIIQTACRYIFIIDIEDFILNPNPSAMLSYSLVVYVLIVLVYIFTTLTTPFIIFGDLSPTEAISKSMWLVFNKFWIIFGLLFIGFIFACLGFVVFCIGVLFTAPFLYSIVYSIYSNTVGIDNINEIDLIGTNEF